MFPLQGDVHKKKKIVQDVTLHDLDPVGHPDIWLMLPVQGDVHKKRQIVQDVTLHDLDSLVILTFV